MIEISAFLSFNLAVVLLISGKILTLNFEILRRYSIPEPVAGGFLCAAFVGLWYWIFGEMIIFDLGARDFLLLMFFAGIGLSSDVRTLLKGGRPLIILIGLAAIFLVLQNLAGMAVATVMGFPPETGLLVGSISLIGGVGTTLAWAPHFVNDLGIGNAVEIGIANSTAGLIVACVIGGPIATYLIRRDRLETSGNKTLDIGFSHDTGRPQIDYFSVSWAVLILNLCIILGTGLHALIQSTGFNLPTFVTCLFAGIFIRNVPGALIGKRLMATWPGISEALSLISDLTLGLFLTMALMGMQLWELASAFSFITASLLAQTVLTLLFSVFVVYRLMGRDYEAAVIASGFGGISLGSTATAIATMTAVTQQFGAAHRAFIIVPLVAGFFIDIINALIIAAFLR